MSTTSQRIGKYELQKLLGSGSVGEVWKGYDLQNRHDVAIKVFYTDLQSDPNFLERLRSQGQVLASLRHPNIVRILDANVARPQEANSTIAYMVMEYVEGTTLADSIRNTSRKGTFPAVSDIVSLFTQLGAAIDYAHEHGIIHGNIKPANILLRSSIREEMRETLTTGSHKIPRTTAPSSPVSVNYGEPMLTDFGVARPANSNARNSALYISPEQARGLPPTRHSDIYSLGVILYEICTGVPPFRSESPVVLMMQHINMQPISPTLINANIPSELSMVILRALAKDSATGFPSASEMAAALADACSTLTTLNNTTVDAQGMSGELEKSTRPISSLVGISTLSTQAAQPAQLQSSRVTRPLPVFPDVPAALDAPKRLAMPVNTANQGGVPARAATRITTPLNATPAAPGRFPVTLDAPERVRTTGGYKIPDSTRLQPWVYSPSAAPTGRVFPMSERDLETPPAMAVMPPAPASTSLSHTFPWVSATNWSSTGPLTLPPPRRVKKFTPIYAWLAAILLLVIVGSVLGTLAWLHAQSAISSHTGVGHVSFQSDSTGQNDMLGIELQNIPNPAPGKGYYAWLVMNGPGDQPTPTLLGKLPVSAGHVNFLYSGDAQHSDLLASVSGLLITEEDANGMPSFPSTKEVYTVEFAQATHPTDTNHLSAFDAIRELLSGEQALNKLGVEGGLAQWLLRDTSKVWLWASNARDYWQGTSTDSKALNFIRGQIVHIVDVFEGKQLDTRDAPIARVALLEQNAVAPDYLDASLSHLNAIASAPDATADQKARAHTISGALTQVKNWLQQVQQDAIQLLNMNDQQFTQSQTQSLLDDMVMQANDAYNGQNDLSANLAQHPGMAQIYNDFQLLATFDVVPYKAS